MTNRLYLIVIVSLIAPFVAYGALTTDGGPQISAKITCYAPGAGGKIEGAWATSKAGAGGGSSVPSTLDDFRLGKSKFVTLAAHPMHYGKWYDLGKFSYVSNIDSREYTISNVVGYVHDTGCAFWADGERFGREESCCRKYNTCSDVYKKYDVAYGDYRRGGNVGLVNSGDYCANRTAQLTQIGGPLTTPPTVVAGGYVKSASLGQGTTGSFPYFYNQPPTSPASPTQPAPPQYQGQVGSAQPGQYFGSGYTTVPANTPFPAVTSAQNTNTKTSANTSGVSSLANSLLNLIRPITSPIVSSTSSIGIASSTSRDVGAISPGTQVIISPVASPNPPVYNPPQTFTESYMLPRPSEMNPTSMTFSSVLENLKGVLIRLAEILRLR